VPALFYQAITSSQLEAIKIASIYFDEVFVVTPISLIRQAEFESYYLKLKEKLVTDFGNDLWIDKVDKRTTSDSNTSTALKFQMEATPLIDSGVIKIVNPFDEINSVNLSDEFTKIIEYRAKAERDKDAVEP
jgi:hypothetical protein